MDDILPNQLLYQYLQFRPLYNPLYVIFRDSFLRVCAYERGALMRGVRLIEDLWYTKDGLTVKVLAFAPLVLCAFLAMFIASLYFSDDM